MERRLRLERSAVRALLAGEEAPVTLIVGPVGLSAPARLERDAEGYVLRVGAERIALREGELLAALLELLWDDPSRG